MKTITQSLLLFIGLIMAFGGLTQSRTTPLVTVPSLADPDIDDTIIIVHTDLGYPEDSSMFQISPLIPSDEDAWFMYFWWAGDNGFSFSPTPKYNHMVPAAGNQAKMTAITTENYGTGGPPPLTYTFTTEHQGSKLPKVLDPGTFLHVQTYRNAVINDTMYLIVTYGNSVGSTLNGRVKIDVGSHAEICHDVLASNPHYFPNGEGDGWNESSAEFEFSDLDSAEERSVLIPVRILDNREDVLEMRIYSFKENTSENSGQQGQDFFKITPAVAHSHDPNIMIAESEAKNQCDYRGEKIHYTVKFQNDGAGRTHYVRVECHLDDKVDLNSISGVTVPQRFYQTCAQDSVRKQYENKCGAIWDIDYDTRVLTIEMHDILLYSSIDPKLPRIDLAQGQVEFDILVKDNYIFGRPVIAHSEIFFDSNKSIVTNVVKTGCEEPISLIDGGGYQSAGQPIICQWIWWILAVLLAIILLLIILLIRSKRKRKRLIQKFEKAD